MISSYLKMFWIVSLIVKSTSCEVPKIDSNTDVAIVSHVLNDVVSEFLLKEDKKFKIVTFSNISQLQVNILSDFMSKSHEKFDWKVEFRNFAVPTRKFLTRSSILVIQCLNFFESSINENVSKLNFIVASKSKRNQKLTYLT